MKIDNDQLRGRKINFLVSSLITFVITITEKKTSFLISGQRRLSLMTILKQIPIC